MNELTPYQQNLPATIEDLARFLLIAPEKANAMRAEIRAIGKLHLAQEVYDQKMDEQRRLCDLILDAEVRMGELTKAIPKVNSNQHIVKVQNDSGVALQKTKTETIQDLGFSPKQVERFETLADNKDIVEQVKAEAHENGTIPTQTKVLDLAQARKKMQDAEYVQIDNDFTNLKTFRKAMAHSDLYLLTEEILDSVIRADEFLSETLSDLAEYIEHLTIVKNKLTVKGANYGKTKRG